MLSEVQKQRLVVIARRAVVARVQRTPDPDIEVDVIDFPGASGVFVTLKSRGELRGCLGTLNPDTGLASEVARCAARSASEDQRFAPVAPDELPELSLEVSVLGPLEPIEPPDPAALTIGRHGLVVEQGSCRGLLLPQVAVEWGWTPEQFLRQTCVKAKLPPDAWQYGADVYRFDAEVFGD